MPAAIRCLAALVAMILSLPATLVLSLPATLVLSLPATLILSLPATAQTSPQKIALHTSLTGAGAFSGIALADAVRFAIDEANAAGASPQFELAVFDDHTTDDGARAAANQAADSDALVAIGPAVSTTALATCPVYAERGLVLIDATVHADAVTNSATTFRTVVSTGEIGAAQANYLARVLRRKRAIVALRDNAYGQPLAAAFQRTAVSLGLAASYLPFRTDAGRDATVAQILADPEQPPVVLGMTYPDAVPMLTMLRRQGYRGIVIGTATMARASFSDLFASQTEQQQTPGFFTDNVYAVSPIIFDSANAETLAFADRYRQRYHRDPSWETAQGYDAATLAIAAVRAVLATDHGPDKAARRIAVRRYLETLTGPAEALPGLTGPMWFTPAHIRPQAVRMGRFHDGQFESAPLQVVAVPHPDQADIAAGAVFEIAPGQYARLQRVVTTGVSINEITRVDLARASFSADLYLWMRYARDAGPDDADPANVTFQNLIAGEFGAAEQTDLADGTVYRLWRVQGEFRNNFDMHRFPFDRQTLSLHFYNSRAAADRVVYVLDRRATPPLPPPAATSGGALAATVTRASIPYSIAAPGAFRKLTQWFPLAARQQRQDLVTPSALGDPRRIGIESVRELSGFLVTIDIQHRVLATLVKAMLPLLLMTVIMFSSLFFPMGLVKEKVTVATTAALAGTVFLGGINNQLGEIGYINLAEYAFYVFFALGLLCIISVMIAERQRFAKNQRAALKTEHWAKMLFLLAVGATMAGAVWASQLN